MQLVCMQLPQQEPISVGEAKQFLRIDHELEDDLLERLIQMARSIIEDYTQRSLLTQVWRLTTKIIPSRRSYLLSKKMYPGQWGVDLPRAPFVKLAAEPLFVDKTTGPEYQIASNYGRGRLLFKVEDVEQQTLQIDFVAGYGDKPESVPPVLRQALLLLVAQLYQQRGESHQKVGNEGVYNLLQPYVWMAIR